MNSGSPPSADGSAPDRRAAGAGGPPDAALGGVCPRCFREAAEGEGCPHCGLEFVRFGGVVDRIGASERERRAAQVEDFYSVSPFPGYGPHDDGPLLLDRSRRSAFLVALDRSLPAAGRILDAGCGTGQTAAFLALAGPRRQVFGADGCKASLACADEFRARAGIDNLQLVRADLFDLPFPAESFPVVISRGVVHHTPDPAEAIRQVAERVEPGGFLVLGFYETWARAFHCSRRGLARLTRRPLALLDPILRARDIDDEKKRIWIDDQYRHPLEKILPLPWVLDVLRSIGLTWVRSVPPAPPESGLLEASAEPSPAARAALRLGWLLTGPLDPDAGLVCVVARKRAR